MPKFRLVQYNPTTSYKGIKTFDCGNDMINSFVYKSMKKRVKKHLSQAYVLLDLEDDEHFIGFYTLDTFSIARESFGLENRPSGFPPVIPVIKLSMLGVDKRFQGKGIGQRLLKDSFLKTIQISKLAGCAGIYLLAEKDAVNFYKNLGFVTLKEIEPLPMFLGIDQILQS